MVSKKLIAVLAASSALALFAASAANAESIVTQERMQLGNSPGPNVPSRSLPGGESIPKMEQKDIPGGN